MSEDVSKPYTTITLESKKNYEEGWERIFGKKRKLNATDDLGKVYFTS